MKALPAPDNRSPAPAAAEAWVILDGNAVVAACSKPARELLAASAAVLRLHGQRLEAPQAGIALQAMLARAAAGHPAALALAREQRLPLTLRCRAVPHGTQGAALLLTLHDPELARVDGALLQAMFKLTPAEARVAAAVAAGRSTAEIGAALGVQPNAVKAHVKRALDKTGTKSQVQLASLLLRSAALVHGSPAATHPQGAGDTRGQRLHLAHPGNDAAPAAAHTGARKT
jgi:DNA-binding CsgD family transcriptional regulator